MFLIVGLWLCQSTIVNAHLYTVAILDAGRNSLSFFLLLIVSLGLSVVRESLGKTMLKCQLLAVAHFLFGGSLPAYYPCSPSIEPSLLSSLWYRHCRA